MLSELAKWLISVTGGAAALVLIAQSLGKHLLSRDIERYRAELQRAAAIELEQLKADLTRAEVAHETRFKWLFARKGEALSQLYEQWTKASTAVGRGLSDTLLLHRIGTRGGRRLVQQSAEPTRRAVAELEELFKAHRPHLGNMLEHKLGLAITELGDMAWQVGFYERVSDPDATLGPDDDRETLVADAIADVEKSNGAIRHLDDSVVKAIRKEYEEGTE